MTERPLNVVHVHAARDNLGDELLTRVLREGLSARLAPRRIDFVGVSSEEAADVRLTGARGESASHRLRVSLASADAALLGPGEVIGPFPAYVATSIAALSMGRPVLWAGVAGKVAGGRIQRWYLEQLLSRAAGVWVRDEASHARLRGIVRGPHLHQGVDLAFAWRPRVATNPRGNAIGLALRGSESRERQWGESEFSQIADALRGPRDAGYRIVLFSFLTRDAVARVGSPSLDARFASDDDVNDFIIGELGGEGVEVVRTNRDPQDVAARMGALSLFIGMRLHSLAIAALSGTPFIALDYADKVAHLAHALDAEDLLVGPGEVGAKLPRLVEHMLGATEGAARVRRTQAKLEGLRARADAVLDEIAQLLRTVRPARAGWMGTTRAALLLNIEERYRNA